MDAAFNVTPGTTNVSPATGLVAWLSVKPFKKFHHIRMKGIIKIEPNVKGLGGHFKHLRGDAHSAASISLTFLASAFFRAFANPSGSASIISNMLTIPATGF